MQTLTKEEWAQIIPLLRAPFPVDEIEFRPAGQDRGDRRGHVRALAYVKTEAICARLDEIVPGNWAFRWAPVALNEKGEVLHARGVLTIAGIARANVGDASSYSPTKGAVSDTLKRCAWLFGIGAYLRRLSTEYVDVGDNKIIRFEDILRLRKTLPRPLDEPRITAEQYHRIVRGCLALGAEIPPEMLEWTRDYAEERLEALRQAYMTKNGRRAS